jgi:hypothetical protein
LSRDDSFGELGVLARSGRFVHLADASWYAHQLALAPTDALVRVLLVSDTHRRKIQKSFQVEGIPLFGAQILVLFLWVALAGLPVVQAFKTTSVVIAVCFWGVGLLRVFGRDLIRQADFGLWFFGPGLSIGALVLFALRFVLPWDAFLVIGLGFPAVLTAIILWRRAKQGYASSRDIRGLCSIPNMSQCFLLFIGLSVFAFEWSWIVPVGVLAILESHPHNRCDSRLARQQRCQLSALTSRALLVCDNYRAPDKSYRHFSFRFG